MAGMEGEEDADTDDTIALLRSALPHDTIVSPVAYYPGTEIYHRAIAKGKISDAIWSEKDDSGMYVLDRKKSRRWIRHLLQESRVVSLKADYKAGDFAAHRRTAGEDCWMTDLLKGDFQLESGDLKQAVTLYKRVIDRCPGNIWGYLKTAEALAETSPVAAIKLFKKAAQQVPSYHGAWASLSSNMKPTSLPGHGNSPKRHFALIPMTEKPSPSSVNPIFSNGTPKNRAGLIRKIVVSLIEILDAPGLPAR